MDMSDQRRFNGKTGEFIRYVAGLALAGLVAYFTTVGTMNRELGEVRTKQEQNFEELLRRLDVLQADIRELRNRP